MHNARTSSVSAQSHPPQQDEVLLQVLHVSWVLGLEQCGDIARRYHDVGCAVGEALTDCRKVRLGSQKLMIPSVPRVATRRVSLQYFTSLTFVCTATHNQQCRKHCHPITVIVVLGSWQRSVTSNAFSRYNRLQEDLHPLCTISIATLCSSRVCSGLYIVAPFCSSVHQSLTEWSLEAAAHQMSLYGVSCSPS